MVWWRDKSKYKIIKYFCLFKGKILMKYSCSSNKIINKPIVTTTKKQSLPLDKSSSVYFQYVHNPNKNQAVQFMLT